MYDHTFRHVMDWALGFIVNSARYGRDTVPYGFGPYASDRTFGQTVVDTYPALPTVLRQNRAFLRRAVRHLAEVGVDQFLDLGSGIPTVGNVHEVAQAARPDALVVYVDHDPVAVTHSRELAARFSRRMRMSNGQLVDDP